MADRTPLVASRTGKSGVETALAGVRAALGLTGPDTGSPLDRLPFLGEDLTAGAENELQAVVCGRARDVDLPQAILQSSFYRQARRRMETGETSPRMLAELDAFLAAEGTVAWDNSWVRLPRHALSPLASQVLREDLRADKGQPGSPLRDDAHRFLFEEAGEPWLRIPLSYLLKLALADAVDHEEGRLPAVRATGLRLLDHFLSDNTSPETLSCHVVQGQSRVGQELARETAKRYLLSQLLVAYANRQFRLADHGQEAVVYFSPHPPVRQKRLNDLISDSFYRELFMSPCLSGWNRGEEKHRYMGLCHQTLSRSQLNAVIKLREAGIITNNLVVLPNTSNVSLANNGVHISLGSRRLTALRQERGSGFGALAEKVLADLVIKIVEHFLPLFVGLLSAAPYRLAFTDFHPERVLGFLPHELHYTHLRMLWRRWRKKAHLQILGQPCTPLGPPWLDRLLSRLFGLKGDFVPDHRLLDYLVALLSTDGCPALDGTPGNHERLKEDLARLGVFDPRMATYLLLRAREVGQAGFFGFEGRHYSLFPSFADLAVAADLQALLTAFACQLALSGRITHADLPDDPFTESERRQVVFAAAIDLPTFFVRRDTGNLLLRQILALTGETRPSRRYPGYLRVRLDDYRQALLRLVRREAGQLVAASGSGPDLDALAAASRDPAGLGAAGRLTAAILELAGGRSPLDLPAEEVNLAAEGFYRHQLRSRQTGEALEILAQDLAAGDASVRTAAEALAGDSGSAFLAACRHVVPNGRADAPVLRRLIGLLLVSLDHDQRRMHRDGPPAAALGRAA
ncbi:MAG: hypothetical protein AB1634_04400 [Thermodesulfobacteriota bacterium]